MLQNPQSQHLVDHASMPNAMQLRYCSSEVKKRLLFDSLNSELKYFNLGPKVKTIAQRYSNPDFFLSQWCSVQEERTRLLEREKKQQRADKKHRKHQRAATGKATAEDSSNQRKPQKRSSVNWQERWVNACLKSQ